MMQILEFLAYNFFGIVALVLAALSYQAKTRNKILLISLFCALSWVLYFIFQGAYISAAVCFVSFLRAVIFYLGLRYKWADHFAWLIFFCGFTIVVGVVGFTTFKDIYPVIAGVLVGASFFMKKEKYIRLISFVGLGFWVVNGIINALYFALISDIISMVSIVIAWIRFYEKKQKNNDGVVSTLEDCGEKND